MTGVPRVLSIAGNDPSGGAGIAADLKTIGALGGYGMAVVTALVAENTVEVRGVHDVPAEFVTAQLDCVFDDITVDAVKIGMLSQVPVIRAVVAALERYRPPVVVLDPVMVAASGGPLIAPDAAAVLRDELVPVVDLITPNLPEAVVLAGVDDDPADESGMRALLDRLTGSGPAVLVKGGHLDGVQSVDLLADSGTVTRFSADRVDTRNTHGTGCTLSSAIATLRPTHPDWASAVGAAKEYLTAALRAADALEIGAGFGPVDHFHALRPGAPS